MLVTELPQVSFTTVEGKIETTDTIISAKSNVPKDENGWIFSIIPLEYQLAYPYCKPVNALQVNILADKYFISRSQVDQRKIATNVKGKEKIEIIYPTIDRRYFQSKMSNNGINIDEFAHRLTGYVFEDND
jgi:hypothetical protein